MVGNDVVDLQLAAKQSNWRRPNYLQKICTDFEIAAIKNSKNPDQLVWEIWSRKEAVYKILLQKGIKKGYYPKKIECLDFKKIGKVQYENTIYFTKTICTGKLVQSLAVENFINFNYIKKVSKIHRIEKVNEIPYLFFENRKYAYSKSHHGDFEEEIYLDPII